ncbi:MAG: PD-(D/E)XK nuclease family protein [Natrialbaceae archaeon]|nr:PD-(D/E)XK nuclease family protein [Natrialbaceae archaeon]
MFENVEDGRGTDFGSEVHDFAENYAEGRPVTPEGDDQRAVAALIDSLEGTLRTEESVYLPVTVGGERVTISGVVDLVHVTDERVEIIDYKTDKTRHAEDEYRKQLSVYYHVVRDAYPDREVTAALFYTDTDRLQPIDPLTLSAIEDLVDLTVREETPEALESSATEGI